MLRIEAVYETGSRAMNEDQLVMRSNLFGVFDGATSLDGYKDAGGRTGAYLASKIVADTFAAACYSASLESVAFEANRRLRDKMLAMQVDVTNKLSCWSTTAAVARVSENRLEWAQIGDSLIMVIMHDGTWQLLTKEFDHDADTLSLLKEKGQEAADADEIRVAKLANVTYGFLNGEPEAKIGRAHV